MIEIVNFDLAINKVIDTTATPGPFMEGDEVTFTVRVMNQGTVDATDVVVNDYIPAGMMFVRSTSTPAFDITTDPLLAVAEIENLAAGAYIDLHITLKIDPNFQGTSLTNNSEIVGATNEYGLTDADDDLSEVDGPDGPNDTGAEDELATDNDYNDEATDPNVTDQNDGITPGTQDNEDDEDSYDPAQVLVGHVYDVALMKTLDNDAGPFYPGGSATFTIQVHNQGTLNASDLTITDYIPTGLTLNDGDWTDNGDGTVSINTDTAGL